MANASELVARDQLNEVGNGEYTVTVGPDGAVLSVQPNGELQTRPKGTAGNYERCKIQGNTLIFRPVGARTFFVGLAQDWPNR